MTDLEKIHYIDLYEIDSTNSELRRRLATGRGREDLPSCTVISADAQTAGRGRSGHEWNSPHGVSVSTSMVIYPEELGETEIAGITLMTAVSVCKAIREKTGLEPQIKWVNDILIGEKKVCGILAERVPEKGAVIIGIGVNVRRGSYPDQLADMATSIEEQLAENMTPGSDAAPQEFGKTTPASSASPQELEKTTPPSSAAPQGFGKTMSPSCAAQKFGKTMSASDIISNRKLTEAIWEQFVTCYREYAVPDGRENILAEYNRHLINRGREVTVLDPAGAYRAKAEGVDEKGRLIVFLPEGGERRIDSGEVSVRGIYGYGI